VVSASHHHSALLVADVERSLAFYTGAFGAEILTRPFTVESPEVATALGGPPGMSLEMAMIRIPPVQMIELIHPSGEDLPDWMHHEPGLVPHHCFQVENVTTTLAEAERLGGTRIWDEVANRGGAEMIYIRDPDANVIELVDAPVASMVNAVLEAFPDARP
jgi:catechol 2,3-dioxygenase-like lactoylglutathione lyase family enzyme